MCLYDKYFLSKYDRNFHGQCIRCSPNNRISGYQDTTSASQFNLFQKHKAEIKLFVSHLQYFAKYNLIKRQILNFLFSFSVWKSVFHLEQSHYYKKYLDQIPLPSHISMFMCYFTFLKENYFSSVFNLSAVTICFHICSNVYRIPNIVMKMNIP